MVIGSKVKVLTGTYEGYYGIVKAIGTEFATVSHSQDFAGVQVKISELGDDE